MGSIKVPEGYRVTVYKEPNFRGDRLTYVEGTHDLKALDFKASSVSVSTYIVASVCPPENDFAVVQYCSEKWGYGTSQSAMCIADTPC